VQNPYEYFPSAQRLLHDAIAEEIVKSPEILERALRTIDRWLEGGHESAERLIEWKTLIKASMESEPEKQKLIEILRDQSESSVHLKSFSPFAGLLDMERRREILFHEH